MAKNIVIGVGNLLFKDDGIGIIAASYLNKNFDYEPSLEVIDGGTLGLSLIEYFVEYDNVLIIDTISTDAAAGTIYKIPSSEVLGENSYNKTAHEVEVVQMLEASELYDKKADVTIFGVVPEDISTTKIGLSDSLKLKFDMLIKTVIECIEALDINVIRKDNIILEDITRELQYNN
ncbi:MAG: HyaD/HybD family hydrogenase maturation endopeptidase [Sulfurimonas sp.]|nr:HyaD/HybD family hydrogenase maturation endopeptidase [Sulfurimonas sp.]